MEQLELAAVVFGLANIVLLVRRSIWNFPFGIAMVSLYAIIFLDQRLYAQAGLQLFFAVVQIYGWVLWTRARGASDTVAVGWFGWPARAGWLAFVAAATLALGAGLAGLAEAAAPYPDAAIAAASIAAQVLLSLRRIETWLLWIAVDAAAIWLYTSRDLHLTAGLYAAFLVLSAVGLREWARAAERQRGAAA